MRSKQRHSNRRYIIALGAGLLAVAIAVAAFASGQATIFGSDTEPTATSASAVDDAESDSAGDDANEASSSSEDEPQTDSIAFANCMRANGVPDFPDPSPEGGMFVSGDIASNPNFATARENCAHLIPEGATSQGGPGQADPEAVLAFAQCMRENGVPNFPDPGASGGMRMGPDVGIDPNSPQVQAAVEICVEESGLEINIRGQ